MLNPRKRSYGLTKAARSGRADAAKFKTLRAAALAEVKIASRALESARMKIDRAVSALGPKMIRADQAIQKVEALAAELLTDAGGNMLTDGVDTLTDATSEAIDDVAAKIDELIEAIKEARRSNV